jgi:hypothetical protein
VSQTDLLWHLLLVLAAVVTAGRLLAVLFQRLGQPPVIGEVIGGILLGPSLLGFVSPQAYAYLLPPALAPFLSVVAQLGIILYMFMVGLELNPEILRFSGHFYSAPLFPITANWRIRSRKAWRALSPSFYCRLSLPLQVCARKSASSPAQMNG